MILFALFTPNGEATQHQSSHLSTSLGSVKRNPEFHENTIYHKSSKRLFDPIFGDEISYFNNPSTQISMTSQSLSDATNASKQALSLQSADSEKARAKPKVDPSEAEDLNLVNALRAAFATDGNPESFLKEVEERISQVEAAIIETCAKNRTRTDDNLYALLESRDAISEQASNLEKSTETASQVTSTVNTAVARLSEKTRVRKNLDAALAVAAQTRKLTRMYARIEDTIDSRRLYTAFRMLKVLEEETKNVQPGTVLEELVPDTHRLRTQITFQARKSFVGWLPAVRKYEQALGAYALHHATYQALSHEHLLESSRAGVITDTYLLPTGPGPTPAVPSATTKPWTPILTTLPTPPQPFSRRPTRPMSAPRMGIVTKPPFGMETNMRPDIGADTRRSFRAVASDLKQDVPMLYLRPLLQSVLVHDGLGLLGDMRSDYRRERLSNLEKLLKEGELVSDEPSTVDLSKPSSIATTRAAETEAAVWNICGFFVVERAVELHSSSDLVPRSTVDGEWWPAAYSRLQELLKGLNENALGTSPDRARAKVIEENLIRFAHVNSFPV